MVFWVTAEHNLQIPLAFVPDFPSGSVLKNPPANAEAAGDMGLIPGLERSPGEGNGKNTPVLLPGEFHGQRRPVATIHGVEKSQTQLSQ